MEHKIDETISLLGVAITLLLKMKLKSQTVSVDKVNSKDAV